MVFDDQGDVIDLTFGQFRPFFHLAYRFVNGVLDFLTVKGKRLSPIEVKSSGYKSHKSFDYFKEKYQLKMNERFIIYTKDLAFKEGVLYIPVYMTVFI